MSMNTVNPAALEAYNKHLERAKERLTDIQKHLDLLSRPQPNLNWGHVGYIESLSDSLMRTIDFITSD